MSQNISARQFEIIEASGRLLMRKGMQGLTTKNLALEMNFTESALYRHFTNKDAIILHLIRYLSGNIKSRFSDIVNTDINPQEKFRALFQSQFHFFKKNPHFIIIILNDSLIDKSHDIINEILVLIAMNQNFISGVIDEGKAVGHFKSDIDTEYMVHITLGSFRLQMLKWKMSQFSFDIEEEGMRLMDSLTKLFHG
jgi:TetR/AcrR family fatty acid metabolism transcriptional regulator